MGMDTNSFNVRRSMFNVRRSPFLLFILIAFTGCTVGPNYTPPTPDLPTAWGEVGPGAATRPTTAAPAVRWWTTFNDPQLDSLVTRAIESNLDLARATARVREARAQRGVVNADLYPNVDVGGAYTHSRSSFNPGGGNISIEQNLLTIGFDAAWEIDVFGGVRRSVEAADADIQAAIEDRRDVLVSLMAEVARNYIDLRGFQRQVIIARENLVAQQETLSLTQTRANRGLASDLDVVRAAAQVSTTASAIPLLESQARQAMHRLGVLLGKDPMALAKELESPRVIPQPPPTVPIGMPSDLLRRRPDIRRAERQLAASTARIGVATADLFPKFSLTGSLGLSSDDFNDLADFRSRYFSIGPSVSWPIFDAGRITSNIEVQSAREQQQLLFYGQSVLNALQEVEDALIAYAKQETHRKELWDAVEANRKAVTLAKQLHDAGRVDFLSVLQAQRDLFISEDALVRSDQNLSTNLVTLYKALGGGWEIESPTTQPTQ